MTRAPVTPRGIGEYINDYELLQPLQNQDAGFSRWTFAVRNGQEYFLKEFMDPIYPTDLDLSPKLRESRIKECQEFEKKRMRLYQAVDDASDGNAVRIIDFFRHGSRYYVATPKIVKAQISFDRIVALPLYQRALLCRSMAHTVMRLHKLHFVHSDIKETNIILCPARNGNLTTKLIDFDASFFEDDPPVNEDELGGDQVYLSPEACLFLFGEEVKLTCAMDVFSLGLLFHQYLTGKLPEFDTNEFFYAHEAVLNDQQLIVSPNLDKRLQDMLRQMLDVDPEKRCTMEEVYRILGDYINLDPCRTGRVPPNMLDMAEDDFVSHSAVRGGAARTTKLKVPVQLDTNSGEVVSMEYLRKLRQEQSAATPPPPLGGSDAFGGDSAKWFNAGGTL